VPRDYNRDTKKTTEKWNSGNIEFDFNFTAAQPKRPTFNHDDDDRSFKSGKTGGGNQIT